MPKAPDKRSDAPETRLVVGVQPVREAIRVHGQALRRVLVERRDHPRLDAIARFASDNGVGEVRRVARAELDALSRGVSHQGALAEAPALQLTEFSELLNDPQLLAIALDEIQDPQNFGAVVRSAVGLARAPVIFGAHAAAPLSTATFRASAGAIEHARLCRVNSLVSTLTLAQERGVQVIGLDAQAPSALTDYDLVKPTLLVIGSEHTGLRRNTRRACTGFAQLARTTTIDSLNASVAAGIALYECMRQRLISDS